MTFDASGRPDPNGEYVKHNGQLVRRFAQPGDHISFDLALMDAASPTGAASRVFIRDAASTFTDAERTFADSAGGQAAVAYAKMNHDLRTGWLGDRAPAFTDAQAVAAVKAVLVQQAASQRAADQMIADAARQRLESEEARQAMLSDLSSVAHQDLSRG